MTAEIRSTSVDRTMVLTIHNPEHRNALGPEIYAAGVEALNAADSNPEVRSVVITGDGGIFSAGGNLQRLQHNRQQPPEVQARSIDGLHDWIEAIRAFPKPVIAAVEGPAAGAGFSLALACDVIVATPRASFCMAFNRIGALPDLAALYTLPRMIGLRRAKDILMSARVVDAREALALGIVHSLHAPAALPEVALAMARRYAQGSSAALAMTKLYANQSLESDYPTMARLEGGGQAACLNSDYFFDAVERFLTRQPAKFGWEGMPVAGSDHSEAAPG